MSLVTANLVSEWVAKLATGAGPGVNSPLTTTWVDNVGSNDGTLYTGSGGFAGTTDSGWDGDGTAGDPYCLVADGTSDYVTLTSAPVTSDADFSIEFWVYSPDVTSVNNTFLQAFNGPAYTGIRIYQDAATDRMTSLMGTGSAFNYPGNTSGVGYGAWLHIVLTYDADGNTAYLYRNASQGTVKSTAFSPYTGTCYLFTTDSGRLAGCKIATCRVYSATLSSTDVTQNYDAGVTAASTDVATPVSQTLQDTYNVSTLIAQTLQDTYNVSTLIAQTYQDTYNVAALVAQTYQDTYNLAAFVSQTLQDTYDVRTLVSQTFQDTYNLGGPVSQTFQDTYNVAAFIAQTLQDTYNLATLVAQTLQDTYNILTPVSQTYQDTYDIAGPIVLNAASALTNSDFFFQVSATLQDTFNVGVQVLGPYYPDSVVQTGAVVPYDDVQWENVTRLTVNDGSYASVTSAMFDESVYSWTAVCQNFHCVIPTGATILGVVVELVTYYATSTFRAANFRLLDGSGQPQGDSHAADDGECTSTDPESPDVLVYGGANELWDATLSSAIINDTDWGVEFAIQALGDNCDAYIDSCRVTIYYVGGSPIIAQTISDTYNIAASVSQTLQDTYDTATLISQTYGDLYDIFEPVGSTYEDEYDVLALVSQTYLDTYDVLEEVFVFVSQTYQDTYNLSGVVSQTLQDTYNIVIPSTGMAHMSQISTATMLQVSETTVQINIPIMKEG